jgi:hypothetical protein
MSQTMSPYGDYSQYTACSCKQYSAAYDQGSAKEYTAQDLKLAIAADRERCANVVRYWLTGSAPDAGTHDASCIADILDGSKAPEMAQNP